MLSVRGRGYTPGQVLRRFPAARRCCRRTGARARSAWFTAALLGNTSNTSGSITTTFVPCAYRTACFPRTPLLKSDSGRMVPPSDRGFGLLCFGALRPGPRATTRRERKSYSGRRSSLYARLDFFFMNFSFFHRRLPRADYANLIGALRVDYYQQSVAVRLTHNDKPFLLKRMSRVCKNDKQRVVENCHRFLKGNVMFCKIPGGFPIIPTILHSRSIASGLRFPGIHGGRRWDRQLCRG